METIQLFAQFGFAGLMLAAGLVAWRFHVVKIQIPRNESRIATEKAVRDSLKDQSDAQSEMVTMMRAHADESRSLSLSIAEAINTLIYGTKTKGMRGDGRHWPGFMELCQSGDWPTFRDLSSFREVLHKTVQLPVAEDDVGGLGG